MVDELLDTVGPLVRKNNNTLTVHCGDDVGTMSSDLMKTRQILLNLLSNAGKFTRDGGVTLGVTRRAEGARVFVEFTVTDTGVGMTLAETEKIFDAFTQADVTTTRKYGGTGLGLALVSRFCELMSGSVSVRAGRTGIAFHRSSAAGGRSGRRARDGRGLMTDDCNMATILVVEDNEASRDALSRRLERHGYRVLWPSMDVRPSRWRTRHSPISS